MESTSLDIEAPLRLANEEVELVAAGAFGPRVLEYRFHGGPNVLGETPGASVDTPFGPFHPHGGHRLWVAPERFPESYIPDDHPVRIERRGENEALLSGGIDPVTGIEKELEIALGPGSEVRLRHRLVMHDGATLEAAAWALTILAPGGTAIVPAEPYRPHPEALLPARPLALWHYTDLSDGRFRLGPRLLRLRCDPQIESPQKIGVGNRQGWAAYLVGALAFVKRFPFVEGATYPDFGSNCEVFTRGSFVELESLGPLGRLAPGGRLEHEETWSLHAWRELPEDAPDEVLDAALRRLLP